MTEKESLGILRHLKEGKKIAQREGICSSDSEADLKGDCNKKGGESESNSVFYNYLLVYQFYISFVIQLIMQ